MSPTAGQAAALWGLGAASAACTPRRRLDLVGSPLAPLLLGLVLCLMSPSGALERGLLVCEPRTRVQLQALLQRLLPISYAV